MQPRCGREFARRDEHVVLGVHDIRARKQLALCLCQQMRVLDITCLGELCDQAAAACDSDNAPERREGNVRRQIRLSMCARECVRVCARFE